jgi:hypothetical protein
MGCVNRATIPAVTGATAVVARGLKKNLEVVPGKHSADSLGRAAIHTAAGGYTHCSRRLHILQRAATHTAAGGYTYCGKQEKEGWGSLLFKEEKCKEQKACDKKRNNKNGNVWAVRSLLSSSDSIHTPTPAQYSLHLPTCRFTL